MISSGEYYQIISSEFPVVVVCLVHYVGVSYVVYNPMDTPCRVRFPMMTERNFENQITATGKKNCTYPLPENYN